MAQAGLLIKFRRLLGLFAFFYASLHMLTRAALYNGFSPSATAADIIKRRFVTAGMTTYLLLLPLALTSTNWAIRKMGGKRWNRLHKLIYVAGVCAIIHYWWGVKPRGGHADRHDGRSGRAVSGAAGAGMGAEAKDASGYGLTHSSANTYAL